MRGNRLWGASQQLQQAPAEILPDETVHNWVHAAVEKGNTNGERQSSVDDLDDITAGDHLDGDQHVHEVEDLMWCPAEEKRQHRGGQHAQRFIPVRFGILLNVLRFEKSTTDQTVAREDDGDGQKEPQNGLHQTEGS